MPQAAVSALAGRGPRARCVPSTRPGGARQGGAGRHTASDAAAGHRRQRDGPGRGAARRTCVGMVAVARSCALVSCCGACARRGCAACSAHAQAHSCTRVGRPPALAHALPRRLTQLQENYLPPVPEHSASWRGSALMLEVHSAQQPRMRLQSHANEYIGWVRARVAVKVSALSPQRVRLFHAGGRSCRHAGLASNGVATAANHCQAHDARRSLKAGACLDDAKACTNAGSAGPHTLSPQQTPTHQATSSPTTRSVCCAPS